MANNHYYKLDINKKSYFSLVVSGFASLLSWVLNVKQKIQITISSVLLAVSIFIEVKLKKISIGVSGTLLKLRMRFIETISLEKISVSFLMKQIISFILQINIKCILINAVMHLYEKFSNSTINVPKIGITNINIVVQKLAPLSDYDSLALTTIDGSSLSLLDAKA